MNFSVYFVFVVMQLAFPDLSIPYLETAESLRDTLAQNPGNREIHYRIADIYLQQREYERAREHLETFLELEMERGE
jgi:thioredoxin-like negative regulator of GroEL